jgi:PAS domain-containing protein
MTNEEGENVAVLGSGEDITDRKQAELALKVSEERFRMMADNIHEGLIIIEDNRIQNH